MFAFRYQCNKYIFRRSCVWIYLISLNDKYPNFEVGLKCILMVNPYLLVCSYIK